MDATDREVPGSELALTLDEMRECELALALYGMRERDAQSHMPLADSKQKNDPIHSSSIASPYPVHRRNSFPDTSHEYWPEECSDVPSQLLNTLQENYQSEVHTDPYPASSNRAQPPSDHHFGTSLQKFEEDDYTTSSALLQNMSDSIQQVAWRTPLPLIGARSPVLRTNIAPSECSSRGTFMSGKSLLSNRSYYSAVSGSDWRKNEAIMELKESDEYAQLLKSKELWPVDPLVEENWSGRGQHAVFQMNERKLVDQILETQEILGSTSSAFVQSVKCRRILLARKSIQCRRGVKKDWALEEVAHLTRLNHSHIVRVIGTYTIGRELSILMYPVAEYNLEVFLETINAAETDNTLREKMVWSCYRFFDCLGKAVEYIHANITRHMDIKPSNILIRSMMRSPDPESRDYKVYIADFGIAKAYHDATAAETDGPTSFTRKYASPEVTIQAPRGFPADIFSLGCVFLEILVTIRDYIDYIACIKVRLSALLLDTSRTSSPIPHRTNKLSQRLQEILKSNPDNDTSYQANLDAIFSFLGNIPRHDSREVSEAWFIEHTTPNYFLIRRMLQQRPEDRCSAQEIVCHIYTRCNHQEGRDTLELSENTLDDEASADKTQDQEN